MHYDDPLGTPEYWAASPKAREAYDRFRNKRAKETSDALKRYHENRNRKAKEVKRVGQFSGENPKKVKQSVPNHNGRRKHSPVLRSHKTRNHSD